MKVQIMPANRVQAMKSRFENLNIETRNDSIKQRSKPFPGQNRSFHGTPKVPQHTADDDKSKSESDEEIPPANRSYLYSRENRALVRQTSDPGKKLHRSHAFRCDRNHKISPKRHESCKSNSEAPTLKIGEKPRLSPDRLRRLNLVIQRQIKKEGFIPNGESKLPFQFSVMPKSLNPEDAVSNKDAINNTVIENYEKELENASSVPDDQVPQHILDQYAKVFKPKKKNDTEVKEMTDSGVSSETEAQETDCEKGRLKRLRQHFENTDSVDENSDEPERRLNRLRQTFENTDSLDETSDRENKEIVIAVRNSDSELYSSTETIKRKNPNILLTETLKKALKQPLPKGPPPQKPPRTFATLSGETPNSPELSPKPERKIDRKKDPKQQLEKLEKALQKHNESKIIIPRQTNIYDIAESDNGLESHTGDKKEIHYLCTEILDIAQRPLLMSSVSTLSDSPASNCFTSLNCGITTSRSASSIPYAKLSAGSSQTLNDDTRSKFSTFFSSRSDKCSGFQCHCCRCSESESARSSREIHSISVGDELRSSESEHIYDEPFKYNVNDTVKDSEDAMKGREVNGGNSYGVVNSALGRSAEELDKDLKIYDIPCDPSRSPSPDVDSETRTFESLRRGFEAITSEGAPPNVKRKSLDFRDARPPPFKSKSLDVPEKAQARNGFSRDARSLDFKSSANPETVQHSDGSESVRVSRSDAELKANTPDLKPKQVMSRSLEIPDLLKHQGSFDTRDIAVRALARSAEDIAEARAPAGKFATERGGRRGRFEKNSPAGVGQAVKLQRRCGRKNQLDVDRENLNKLMSEIYDTVTAQCDMETVSRFPVDQECSSSEDSIRLSRSLTEKRKTYVRRVSSRVAYLEPRTRHRCRRQTMECGASDDKYTTFRSWKSFRRVRSRSFASKGPEEVDSTKCFGTPEDMDQDAVDGLDDTAGCLDIDRPQAARERGLFDLCLLVGLNHSTGQAYVKSVFPNDAQVPPYIENLVFPETISQVTDQYDLEPSRTQSYSLVLTNERGERSFGYCRRVLPEDTGFCLPLAYCLISRFRAPGFYYKVLQELESRHGTSAEIFDAFLEQLFGMDFPNPGESVQFAHRTKKCPEPPRLSRNSLNASKSKTLEPKRTPLDYQDGVPVDVTSSEVIEEVKVIKRPIEPRLDEDNLSVLMDSMGLGLVVKVFGTMLLERKVVLVGDNLSQLSSCMEALQALIYPLVWQQPLVSVIPSELRRDMLEAPLPILAGLLMVDGGWDLSSVQFEEGMLIDLCSKGGARVVFEQGDESTIIPSTCYKTLKTALQMESSKNLIGTEQEVEKARNVLIAEAFLRFFVDILCDFWQHFKYNRRRDEREDGSVHEEDVVVFDKEQLISRAPNKQTSHFLEWFTETAMFNHLALNMSRCHPLRIDGAAVDFGRVEGLVDLPVPNFYEVFDERLNRRQLLASARRRPEPATRNVRTALNKKVRLLKRKLKDLVN